MRRWNGWGDEGIEYPLPESAGRYLRERLGPGQKIPDAGQAAVLQSVPASHLPDHQHLRKDPLERLRHARGQSLPDWVALRSGEIGTFPDAVAFPDDDERVCELLRLAAETDARLIPYGGGTSVVGHINPLPESGPTLTVDISRIDRLLRLDDVSHTATFGAGVKGPQLEAQLNTAGYTLGHFPQSFEQSTLGGWIATRSAGQQSYYYGRIEDRLAGVKVITPAGVLELPSLPASAAGPDLRESVLGSEGRLGVITQATVRVHPLPEQEAFYGLFFQEWESGVTAVREMVQSGAPASMLRLSDPQETETTLALSGKEGLVRIADLGLGLLGFGGERCLLIFGATGDADSIRKARSQVVEIARRHGGLFTGSLIGEIWRKSRFRTPYLRNTLWENGYALDTLETALPWSLIMPAAQAIKAVLAAGLADWGERVLVFAHLSHLYRDGASLYVTYLFRRSPDPQETLERWQRLKSAASRMIVLFGGTISHQHGVGTDHAAYLEPETSSLGIDILSAAFRAADPEARMNPGKLLRR